MTVSDIFAAIEPAAWKHPELNWVSVDRSKVIVHCFKIGPFPVPLFTAEQLSQALSDALKQCEAQRERAEAERDEVHSDFSALQKGIVGETGLSAILHVDTLKAATSALQQIARMKVFPDDIANRATLVAAISLARAVAEGSPHE